MPLAAGTRLGPYEIVAPLGAGGMGEVHLARDTRLEREVALKLLPVDVHADSSARRRLLNEARLGARLEHPGICPVYEVGEDAGRAFIAMQRIPGRTLAAEIDAGAVRESRAIDLAIQIATAVAHAHEHGVIHRDLKPQNVMVTPEGRAIVLDFGLARGATFGDSDSALTVTAAGIITGTPTAMSPEQARGEPLDARSDVFSFGTLLHTMLSGREPFARPTSADTIAAILTVDPPPLTGASAEISRIVDKCLAKDRDLRYGSMREVLVDLERVRRGASNDTPRPAAAAPAPARRPRPNLPIALAALVAIGVAAVLLTRGGSHAPTNVRSLAVLPFRSLATDGQQNFLGLGMADAVISRASQDSGLVVRPTSAVRRYVTADVDAARAGGELKVDAVLEGTWQQEGDRLRVTANLLRVADGVSLWSDRFEAESKGVFEIEDQISEQLVTKLRGRLANEAPHSHGGTRNPEAYAAYTKGLFYLSERGFDKAHRGNSDNAIRLFQDAVALDPGYARAHAQLADAYAWSAIFIDLDSTFVSRAEHELAEAERLDPDLGLVHVVRGLLYFSSFKGWRIDDAIREFREAERLGEGGEQGEIGSLYMHLGLDAGWRKRMQRAIAEDPTNLRLKHEFINEAYFLDLPEEGRKLQKELLGQGPDLRYWFAVREVERAATGIETSAHDAPDDPYAQIDLAILEAARKHAARSDALIRRFEPRLARDRAYHHMTFECAQAYALGGDARRAVHWLEVTVDWGFPCYPVFQRDWCLDPIRKSPEFTAFMERLRPEWERYRAEFEQ